MTFYNGTISIDVDESANDKVVELARELDESAVLTSDEHTGVESPPLEVCISIIANHSEGLDRLITGSAGKVGWVIDIQEVTNGS